MATGDGSRTRAEFSHGPPRKSEKVRCDLDSVSYCLSSHQHKTTVSIQNKAECPLVPIQSILKVHIGNSIGLRR